MLMSDILVKEKSAKNTAKRTCYHCGEPCQQEHVHFEGKDFCCNGCKTVYQILAENNLCQYYELDQNPGITLQKQRFWG